MVHLIYSLLFSIVLCLNLLYVVGPQFQILISNMFHILLHTGWFLARRAEKVPTPMGGLHWWATIWSWACWYFQRRMGHQYMLPEPLFLQETPRNLFVIVGSPELRGIQIISARPRPPRWYYQHRLRASTCRRKSCHSNPIAICGTPLRRWLADSVAGSPLA